MKNRLLPFLLVLMVSGLAGCAANRLVSNAQKADLPALHIPYNVQHIEITDERANVSSDDIKLPPVSLPNQQLTHVPVLLPAHAVLIERVLQENTSGTGQPVQVIVTMLEGHKEFSATWTNEKERGFARVQILFLDPSSGKEIAGCNSSGDFFVQSADATTKRVEEVYQIALRNVVYNCLSSIHAQMN